MTTVAHAADEVLLGFTRALRAFVPDESWEELVSRYLADVTCTLG